MLNAAFLADTIPHSRLTFVTTKRPRFQLLGTVQRFAPVQYIQNYGRVYRNSYQGSNFC